MEIIRKVREAERKSGLLFWSLLGYFSLYFIPNNKGLLVLLLILFLIFYRKLKNIFVAGFLVYLFFLPFERGKGIALSLVPSLLVSSGLYYWSTFTFADLAYLVLFFLFVRQEITKRDLLGEIPLGKRDFVLLLFLMAGVIPLVFTSFPEVSFLGFLRLVRTVTVFWVAKRIFHSGSVIKESLLIIASSLLFQSGWSLLQFIRGGPLGRSIEQFGSAFSTYGYIATDTPGLFRAVGTFIHPNTLASFIGILLPLFLVLLLKNNHKREFQIYLIIFVMGCGALLVTASRAAWIVEGLIFVLSVIYLNNRQKIKISPSGRKLFLRLVVLPVIAAPFLMVSRLSNFFQTFEQYGSLSYRFDLITKAVEISQKYPFGIGLGAFPGLFAKEFPFEIALSASPPHNLLAQILPEMGLLGVVFFLIFAILVGKEFFKTINRLAGWLFYLKVGAFFSWIAFWGVSMFYPLFLVPNIFDYFFIFSALLVL